MQSIIISGGLGRDAELKTTQSGDKVLSFSVGVSQGFGDRKKTNWYRCSVWGKRADTLSQYLLKGVKVVAQGELTIGEYDGKPQYEVRVNELDFMSRAESSGSRDDSRGQSRGGGNGGASPFDHDLSDDVPFASADPRHELRKRAVL